MIVSDFDKNGVKEGISLTALMLYLLKL